MSIAGDSLEGTEPALLTSCSDEHLQRKIESNDERAGIAFLKRSTPLSRSRTQIEDVLGLETNDIQSLEQTCADLTVYCRSIIKGCRSLIEAAANPLWQKS